MNLDHFFQRESDLSTKGYLQLAQEISYQWLGALATPAWWSDAHLNKALVGYLAAEIAFKVSLLYKFFNQVNRGAGTQVWIRFLLKNFFLKL